MIIWIWALNTLMTGLLVGLFLFTGAILAHAFQERKKEGFWGSRIRRDVIENLSSGEKPAFDEFFEKRYPVSVDPEEFFKNYQEARREFETHHEGN